ncbi:hypothetical protein [Methylotenera sp. G11]|uniref:hypothetical protein n=1 Tax=Methylotenera sp. G11 TaxID=1506585 RepID=UPI000646012C|nr:hypothetical protein [Methylotenera sp. G11]
MNRSLKNILFGLLVACSLAACKQAQQDSAQAAKETITEMKANTLDAAKDAAADAERAASDIAKAVEQVEVPAPAAESADK